MRTAHVEALLQGTPRSDRFGLRLAVVAMIYVLSFEVGTRAAINVLYVWLIRVAMACAGLAYWRASTIDRSRSGDGAQSFWALRLPSSCVLQTFICYAIGMLFGHPSLVGTF